MQVRIYPATNHNVLSRNNAGNMDTQIILTDREVPATPLFHGFLDGVLNQRALSFSWHDQVSEAAKKQGAEANFRSESEIAATLQDPRAQRAMKRCNELFAAILTGATDKLEIFNKQYRFIVVVGAPRSGGSYLTKILFQAIGMVADKVPRTVAHDGFPDLSPFFMVQNFNAYTGMQRRMAEYLVMVELYFADSQTNKSTKVIPKKASKAAYHGAFFNRMLGGATEYLVTIRHPISSCISTYERAGGFTPNGKFLPRGNIEIWAARDYLFTAGGPEMSVLSQDYFDVYLRFWEHYHYNLALTGLSANKNWSIIPYTREAMESAAQGCYDKLGCHEQPDAFKVFDKRSQHTDWQKKSEQAIRRVSAVWDSVGLRFPVDAVMEQW
jgi:hypothetical protein